LFKVKVYIIEYFPARKIFIQLNFQGHKFA
jgi:hypothetical protein